MEQLVLLDGRKRCRFCGLNKNDYLNYGPLYRLEDVVAHYYCVLLSNKINQNGQDQEGMLGFLLCDIKAELRRISTIKCFLCRRENASINCSFSKCKKIFHLPCGIKAGSLHQFVGQFKSFCPYHRPVQNIPGAILREAQTVKPICCICYEYVNVSDKKVTLWAPCCAKTWYHRSCCQKLAHSAGYFFKCAICNNSKKFKECMQKFGIFIPQQDASWELVPNAFEELLFRYSNCDADMCKCPGGRKENVEDTRWEIILCQSCGSQGIHIGCGNLKFVDPEWECTLCKGITNNNPSQREAREKAESSSNLSSIANPAWTKEGTQSECFRKKRRRVSQDLENSVLDKRKKKKSNIEDEDEEEEDVEVEILDVECNPNQLDSDKLLEEENPEKADDNIDVETIESNNSNQRHDIQEVLSLLKPGPLSYKLAVLRRELESTTTSKREASETREEVQVPSRSESDVEVVELSDSDEGNKLDEIEIIEETFENRLNSIIHYRVKKEPVDKIEDDSEEEAPEGPEPENFEVVGSANLMVSNNTLHPGRVPPSSGNSKDACTFSPARTTKVSENVRRCGNTAAETPGTGLTPVRRPELKKTDEETDEDEVVVLEDDNEIILD